MRIFVSFLFISILSLKLSARETNAGVAGADPSILDVMIVDSNTMPNMELVDGIPTRGIIKDLYELIAQKAKRKLKYVLSSRARIDQILSDDGVDLRCFISPDWTTIKDQLTFSKALFVQDDLVLSLKGKEPIRKLTEINGKKIVGVLGYHYPNLEKPEVKLNFKRVDVKTHENALDMVLKKHEDYAIVSSQAFQWYLKTMKIKKNLFNVPFVLESTTVHCAVNRTQLDHNKDLVSKINSISKAEINSILKKYSP